MKRKEYAVIDIGSNSLRLLKGWQDVPGTWQFGMKELATTRLGKDMDKTKHLSAEGMEASFQAMAQWQPQLVGVPVCAVATSAVREARDGQAFLAEVRARFGWHCRAVTGLEEAMLSFSGATSRIRDDRTAAVLDIGGGSSEVAVGENGEVRWSHSYPIGAVRLTEDDTFTPQGMEDLRQRCRKIWLPMKKQADVLIGVGGTLTTLAAMDQEMTVYDPAKVDGYRVSAERLSYHIESLLAMTPEERRHVAGLQPKRSDIIITGLVIAQTFLETYNIEAVTVSERDLMEGVFFRHSFHDAAWRAYRND